MESYYRELVYFLRARLGNPQQAEDVVHDAYLRVLERSSETPIEQPRAFLYRTAMNLAIDGKRYTALRQMESLDVLEGDERFFSPPPRPTLTTSSAWTWCARLWMSCLLSAARAFTCASLRACPIRRSPTAWVFPKAWWRNTSSMP